MTELLEPTIESFMVTAIDDANSVKAFRRGLISMTGLDFDWEMPDGLEVSTQWTVANRSGLYECTATLTIAHNVDTWPDSVLTNEGRYRDATIKKFGLEYYDELTPVAEGYKVKEEKVLSVSLAAFGLSWREESEYTLFELAAPEDAEDHRVIEGDCYPLEGMSKESRASVSDEGDFLEQMLAGLGESIHLAQTERRIRQAISIFRCVREKAVIDTEPLLADGSFVEVDEESDKQD